MVQASSPSMYEAAVHNTPQLQLVILQIFAQLQHERDFVKSENQMYKFQLSRIEDRCRKEQMRRITTEHQMNEQVGVFQAKTQAALETAAEVQRLLKKAEQDLATTAQQANKFKELSDKKDNVLTKLKNEIKLLEQSVHMALKDTKVIHDVVKRRRTNVQPSLEQSGEIEEKLRESMKRADHFQRLAEQREQQLKTAEGKIEANERQLQAAKEEIKYLQEALLNASQNAASCEEKYKLAVEETLNLKNSMKADKEQLIQTWMAGNATMENLQLALEAEKNKTRGKEESERMQMAEENARQNEKEATCLLENQKLQQDLEMERNRSSSLQFALEHNVYKGFSNITELITTFVYNQEKCDKEKQQLQEKLEEEKRTCEQRNSGIHQNILTVLQELKETTNENRQTSAYIKETLLTDLQSERNLRASLQSTMATNIPAQIDCLKDALELHHQNMTNNLDTYIIKPKENLKKLPYVLRGRPMADALHAAARTGNVTELQILLDAGANIESYDERYKETPLIWAAEYGKLEACRFLLQRGANIQAKASSWGNRTPLHAAAVNNRLDVIKLLVEMGADLTAKDSDGRTPAEVGNDNTKAWFRNRSG